MTNSPHYGAEFWSCGPTGIPGTVSLTEVGGVEPSSVYVVVGGETRVTIPNLDLSSVYAVGIPSMHAPTVVYTKGSDGSFLIPPSEVARFTFVVSRRI